MKIACNDARSQRNTGDEKKLKSQKRLARIPRCEPYINQMSTETTPILISGIIIRALFSSTFCHVRPTISPRLRCPNKNNRDRRSGRRFWDDDD